MNFQVMRKQRKFVLIAALVGVISIFLPWVSTSGLFAGISVNGFNSGGVIVFIAFVAAGVMAFLGDQTKAMEKKHLADCTGSKCSSAFILHHSL